MRRPTPDGVRALARPRAERPQLKRITLGGAETLGDALMAKHAPISLKDKFATFSDHWAPKVIAQMNDYQFKLVRVQGDFVWHRHPDTDEVFLVIEGDLTIAMREGEVRLRGGEMFVVPRGTEHKPYASKECKIMLIEPSGTPNTGDAGGDRTAPPDVWI